MTTSPAAELRAKMRSRVANARQNRSWYEINNATTTNATVRIYEEIGFFGVTADQFAADLATITAPNIEVQINSPGGDVFDGIAIFNALRTHAAHVTTRVDGIAASAASMIVQAGDRRVMLGASQMMIHDAWGVAVGPASELRAFADILEQQNEVIAGVYAQRSGRDVADISAMMSAETWLTDQGAVDAGLADEVVIPEPAAQNSLTPRVTNTETDAILASWLDRRLDMI
jgi:ATP-dependent Clp endopeptidase proteolytic subunit ClpP